MFKIIFIVFLTLFSVKSFANINGAGFIGSPTGISFESSRGYGLNQNSYLQSVAGVFGCPQPGEGQTMILHDLDPKTGRITCYLYDETSTDPVQIFKQNISSEEKILAEASSLRQILDNGEYKNLNIGTRYGSYEFNTNPGYTENYIQYFNLRELSNKNETIQNFLNDTTENSGDGSAFSNTRISLDSHSNPERVLSNILTGLITLNPDFFEPDSLVNANGTIALKDYALFGEGNTSGDVSSDNFLKKITRSILGGNNNNSIGVQVTTLVSFIDKKFWGFYAYLIYNLKEAYIAILGTLMLFGGGYALSRYGYTRVKSKINKDNENQDNGKLASKSMDVFLVFAMFLIPISTNTASIPDSFIYTKSNQTFYANSNDSQAEELFSHSTLSSGLIRYFSNLGSSWANVVNDYALFSYLRYLESKQKSITASGLSQNENEIKLLFSNTFYLKKEYDFYINVCRSAFKPILETTTRFNSISDEAKESFLNNTINLKGSPIYNYLGYSKINPMLCLNLEENIATKTKKLLGDYSRIQMELEISNSIINNFNSETAKQFDYYVDFMEFISNNYGWISVAVVPPSYSILFNGNSSVFAYDVFQKKIANNDGNNLSQTFAGNNEEKKEIADESDGGFVSGLFYSATGSFVWFVLPGFSDVFQQVHKLISNIGYLDPTAMQLRDNKGDTKKGIISKFVDVIIGMLSKVFGVLGYIGSKIVQFLQYSARFISTTVLYTVLLALSLWIAIQLYVVMMTTVVMVVIGGAITIKVCLYFMELLMYYFLTDAILFISIVTQRNEYFVKFLSKGMTITLLTPLLIVLSVYIYILFHTLSIELYKMLVNAIYEVTSVQHTTIVENSEQGAITSIMQGISIHATQSFGEVIILLFSLIIGVVSIFKFKDWVFKIIGIEDSDFSSSMSDSINQKLTGGVNPVK